MVAVIGLAFGVATLPMVVGYVALLGLGPIAAYATTGLHKIGPLFIAYVMRKPGAAFLLSMLTFLVITPFAPVGPAILVTGFLHGLTCEIGVAIATRYKHFTTGRMVAAGLIACAVHMLFFAVVFQVFNFELPMLIAILAVAFIGCGLAGLAAKALADVILKTGVLNNTTLGRERVKEV